MRARTNAVLYIVEADASVRDALCRLANSVGFKAQSFASVEQYVAQSSSEDGGCVLLDSSLLGAAACLTAQGRDLPVIVMSAGGSDASAARVDARRFGARLVLSKPIDSQALFDVVWWFTEDEGQSLVCERERGTQ
jgi:two-component system, LuxR family, response regulator FixJ